MTIEVATIKVQCSKAEKDRYYLSLTIHKEELDGTTITMSSTCYWVDEVRFK